MEGKIFSIANKSKQLGFHYYDDTDHYDEASLDYWLPKLQAAGTRWLVLSVFENIEIPENFMKRITEAGIEPVISLQLSLSNPPLPEIFRERAAYYRKNGVHLIQFFSRPNMKNSWKPEDWLKPNLVERFIAVFSEYAEICINQKIIPVFPLLQPGGDYWDISFLKESLHILNKQYSQTILPNIIFSADAGFQEHPLDWGKGGPEVCRPAFAYKSDQADHRGFYIFEWYHAIIQKELGKNVPIILFHTGRWTSETGPFDISPKEAKQQLFKVLSMLQEQSAQPSIASIPAYVISCNLYKLPSEYLMNLKFESEPARSGKITELRKKFRKNSGTVQAKATAAKTVSSEISSLIWSLISALAPYFSGAGKTFLTAVGENFVKIVRSLIAIILRGESISSYFLIPDAESLLTEEQKEIIRQYTSQKSCKSGRNLNEALSSPKVILLNDNSLYPKNIIKQLRYNNCQIQTVSVSNHGN